MTQVYFRCSNPKEVLVDRCGAVVDDLAEARDHAACVVRSLTMAQPRGLARLILHVSAPRAIAATGSRCRDQDHRGAPQSRFSRKLPRADGHYLGLR